MVKRVELSGLVEGISLKLSLESLDVVSWLQLTGGMLILENLSGLLDLLRRFCWDKWH